MKKVFLALILISALAAFYVFKQSQEFENGAVESASSTSSVNSGSSTSTGFSGSKNSQNTFDKVDKSEGDVIDKDGEIIPAVDVYSSAEQALTAIMEAAKDYDDLVLEQFAELPRNCAWCEEFYAKVNEMMLTESDDDVKSYYAEVLSVSGRVENISTLINAAKGAERELDAEIFAEAIEIAIGGEDLVEFLSENLNDTNELVGESVLAALTNHGSRKAVEEIYNHTLEKGDPDGFYSLGIGLGEIIPDDESFPYLREVAGKRDQYSHLAIKSLLNAGDSGLREVVEIISNSPQNDETKNMLQDAVDHVAYDEDTERYVNDVLSKNKNPIIQDFLNQIKEDLEFEEEQ